MFVFTIKEKRLEKNFSISKLAKKTNLSRTYIRDLENNRRTNVSISVLYSIATVLDVNIKDLFYTKCDIDTLKLELYRRIDKYGLNSKQSLEISQVLDILINIDIKEKDKHY